MYYYEENDGRPYDCDVKWIVRDENASTVCLVPGEADAKEIVAALNHAVELHNRFSGLVTGEEHVNAADLVDLFNGHYHWDDEGYFHEGARP